MAERGRHDPTGPVGVAVGLLVIVAALLGCFVGWLVAGGITTAVGFGVGTCALLLVGGTAVLARVGVLSLALRLPGWFARVEEEHETAGLPWSPAVQRVVNLGAEEAAHFRQGRIAPEHLLLGLMREGGDAARALDHLGVSLERLIRSVDFLSGMGSAEPEAKPSLDPASRRVLDAAGGIARTAHARTTGTGHLLLALASDAHGTAAAVLEHLGCTPAALTRALRETRN